MIEKEAESSEDRPLIAGVIYNRLARRDDARHRRDAPVRRPDARRPALRRPTSRPTAPYNTRINAGLPPTPIASPGLASLRGRAAARPTRRLPLLRALRRGRAPRFAVTYAEHLRQRRCAASAERRARARGSAGHTRIGRRDRLARRRTACRRRSTTRRSRALGLRLGLRAAAGRARASARRRSTGLARARVRRRERHDAAQDRGRRARRRPLRGRARGCGR